MQHIKFHNFSFAEYISDLAPIDAARNINYDDLANTSNNARSLTHRILYGPPGVGKHTVALQFINKHSPRKMMHEHKSVVFSVDKKKTNWLIRASDIHSEIDVAFFGSAPKNAWGVISTHIANSAGVGKFIDADVKYHFLLFHNVQMASTELLEVLYEQMRPKAVQSNGTQYYFILMTTQLGFIPQTIRSSCITTRVKRPAISEYIDIMVASKSTEISTGASATNETVDNAQMRQIAHETICQFSKCADSTGLYKNENENKNENDAHDSVSTITSIKRLLVQYHFKLDEFLALQSKTQDIKRNTHVSNKLGRSNISLSLSKKNARQVSNRSKLHAICADTGEYPAMDTYHRRFIVCKFIIDAIKSVSSTSPLNFADLRTVLYNICIYKLGVEDCIWIILSQLCKENIIPPHRQAAVLFAICGFLYDYVLCHKEIFHLERCVCAIITEIT